MNKCIFIKTVRPVMKYINGRWGSFSELFGVYGPNHRRTLFKRLLW